MWQHNMYARKGKLCDQLQVSYFYNSCPSQIQRVESQMLKLKVTTRTSYSVGKPLMIDERTLGQNLFIILNKIKKVEFSTQNDSPVSRYSRLICQHIV